jgi:hypothetical protein
VEVAIGVEATQVAAAVQVYRTVESHRHS